jgi:hypothetical protein
MDGLDRVRHRLQELLEYHQKHPEIPREETIRDQLFKDWEPPADWELNFN